MKSVCTGKSNFDNYENFINEKEIEKIYQMSSKLADLKILFVNQDDQGGGDSEILQSLVPLMRDLNLYVDWKLIEGDKEFYEITRKLHCGLCGMPVNVTNQMKKKFLDVNKYNVDPEIQDYDIVFIEDYQAMAIIGFFSERKTPWIWRCHIDPSKGQKDLLHFINKFARLYDATIFTRKEYANRILCKGIYVIPPAIDPLSEKNRKLSLTYCQKVLDKYKIDFGIPTISQISRFDPLKDPFGVIDAFRSIKDKIQSQLFLVGTTLSNDPDGPIYYQKTLEYAASDRYIRVIINPSDEEVNAFQRLSLVVVQRSLAEGFGLTVSEAMWKKRAVVGSNTGGIALQIKDGFNGFLVNNVKEFKEKIEYLLINQEKAEKMGERGYTIVYDNFLITRLVVDYLQLIDIFCNK